jgi:hypothetical protein
MSDESAVESSAARGWSSASLPAWAGAGLTLLAALLYGVLFWMLAELPERRAEFDLETARVPVLTRLLVVGVSAGLLNSAGLTLSLAGWVFSGSSRVVSVIGTIVSLIMFLAVASVVLAGLLASSS